MCAMTTHRHCCCCWTNNVVVEYFIFFRFNLGEVEFDVSFNKLNLISGCIVVAVLN